MADVPAAGVPVVPKAFALRPALANRDILDYISVAGAKVYRGAIAPIAIEFDCKSENLQQFLDQGLQGRYCSDRDRIRLQVREPPAVLGPSQGPFYDP